MPHQLTPAALERTIAVLAICLALVIVLMPLSSLAVQEEQPPPPNSCPADGNGNNDIRDDCDASTTEPSNLGEVPDSCQYLCDGEQHGVSGGDCIMCEDGVGYKRFNTSCDEVSSKECDGSGPPPV